MDAGRRPDAASRGTLIQRCLLRPLSPQTGRSGLLGIHRMTYQLTPAAVAEANGCEVTHVARCQPTDAERFRRQCDRRGARTVRPRLACKVRGPLETDAPVGQLGYSVSGARIAFRSCSFGHADDGSTLTLWKFDSAKWPVLQISESTGFRALLRSPEPLRVRIPASQPRNLPCVFNNLQHRVTLLSNSRGASCRSRRDISASQHDRLPARCAFLAGLDSAPTKSKRKSVPAAWARSIGPSTGGLAGPSQ